MLLDGYIFAWLKGMVAKTISSLVVIRVTQNIVMESPGTPGLSDHMAYFVFRSGPETLNPAVVSVSSPRVSVNMAAFVDGRRKLVPAIPPPRGMVAITGKLQPDFLKRHLI